MIIANANVSVPDQKLLASVLRANGYDGSVGCKFLFENYGNVVSNGSSEVLAFFGIHVGPRCTLMSRRRLQWNHYIRRIPMSAGFFQRKGMVEYNRLQNLKGQLGSHEELDIVGCISNCSNRILGLNRVAFAPPAWWWLGMCERGWLAIDMDYYLLDIYDSLSDLLNEQGGIEVIAEESCN